MVFQTYPTKLLFMVKPEFIQYLELQEGVFSVMKFHRFDKNILKYFDEKKYDRVFEIGVVNVTGKARWDEVIYKTKQEFYLGFKSTDDGEFYILDIYYKPENYKELLFFINQLLKPFKDGTINDTTTQG